MSETPSQLSECQQIFFKGDEYFEALLKTIDHAKNRIELEAYIFAWDRVGKRVLSSLRQAAHRGVEVRLLVDGVGSLEALQYLIAECGPSPIDLRVFHPLPFAGHYLSEERKPVREISKYLSWLNKRNHRKVLIVDQSLAFLGGANVWEVHSEKFLKAQAWRDTSIQIAGKEIERLSEAFEWAWTRALLPEELARIRLPKISLNRQKPSKPASHQKILLNYTPRLRKTYLQELTEEIRSAQKRVWITTPYLNPHRKLIRALFEAVDQGASVKLLLPEKTDFKFSRWMNLNHYGEFLARGIQIFEYQSSILHAKTSLIDESARVGSSNINIRSLVHDLEVEYRLDEPSQVKLFEAQWKKDLLCSKEITLDAWKQSSWIKRMFLRFIFLFRRWL